MPTPATVAEQEALFQEILRRIPAVEDPGTLSELVHGALSLMLRRPGDRALRDDLNTRLDDIIAGLHPDATPEIRRSEMRCAARASLRLLRMARERRLSRADETKRTAPRRAAFSGKRAIWASAGAVTLAGAALWGLALIPGSSSTSAQAARLVAEMTEAGRLSAAPPPGGGRTHVFGGPLRTEQAGGRALVIAEGVPPAACVAAGWALVRTGLITINGVTPNRVSALRINELCHQEEGDATLAWMPK